MNLQTSGERCLRGSLGAQCVLVAIIPFRFVSVGKFYGMATERALEIAGELNEIRVLIFRIVSDEQEEVQPVIELGSCFRDRGFHVICRNIQFVFFGQMLLIHNWLVLIAHAQYLAACGSRRWANVSLRIHMS